MQVQPYLMFNGRAEEAIQFYQRAIGAKVEMMMRFKDNPEPPSPEACAAGGPMPAPDKVMHASMKIGDSVVMCTDGGAPGQAEFKGFSLTLDARDEAEAKKLFDGLADGGQVHMPLGRTFFSPCFGVVADRFGVSWMVIVPQPM